MYFFYGRSVMLCSVYMVFRCVQMGISDASIVLATMRVGWGTKKEEEEKHEQRNICCQNASKAVHKT